MLSQSMLTGVDSARMRSGRLSRTSLPDGRRKSGSLVLPSAAGHGVLPSGMASDSLDTTTIAGKAPAAIIACHRSSEIARDKTPYRPEPDPSRDNAREKGR